MKEKSLKTMAIAFWVAIVLGIGIALYDAHRTACVIDGVKNSCILESPRYVISGCISGWLPKYYIFYRGKCNSTGDVCKKLVRVTEREYDRTMYR